MLIQGFNHHYRAFQQKLFHGATWELFATTPDDGSQPAQAPAQAQAAEKPADISEFNILPDHIQRFYTQEDWFIKNVKEMVPGERAYNDETREKVHQDWMDEMKEYNGMSGFIKHFDGLLEFIDRPDFNPEHPRWQGKFQAVMASFSNVQAMLGSRLSEKTRSDILSAQNNSLRERKASVKADIQDIQSAFVQMRADILKQIEEQMCKDFNARLVYLRKQWTTHTPQGHGEKEKGQWLKLIDAGIKDIKLLPDLPTTHAGFKDGDKRVEAYKNVWNYLDRLEDSYEAAKEGDHYEFSRAKLILEYKKLQKLKAQKVDTVAADYAKRVDEIIPEFESLIALIKSKPIDEHDADAKTKRDNHIKEIEGNIKRLRESRDVGRLFQDGLDSEEAFMVQDPAFPNDPSKKVPFSFNLNGTDIKMPLKRGLKQQIDLFTDESIPLSKEERRQLAFGVKQAMEKYRTAVGGIGAEVTEKLPHMLDQIKIQKMELDPVKPKGGYKWAYMAPSDVSQALHIISEWATRRYDRVSKGRVGDLGEKSLKFLANTSLTPGPLSPLRGIPAEFGKEAEHAMHGEYTHFKEIYAAHDMFHVEHIAMETSNQDELKGCLLLLSENGRLNWYNPKLWKQLNRFQKTVSIPMSLRYNLSNFSKFQDSLRRACGEIWDYDSYNSMNNANNSAFDSKKSGYAKDLDTVAEQAGGLNLMIDDMLKSHKNDPHEAHVDPIKYEAIIDYAIAKGKMDPEGKLYYIIQGIANGILTPDRGSALDSKFVNDYPAIEYFHSPTARGGKPTMEDLKEVALMDMELFYDWFHVHVMNLPAVYQRTNKTLTQGNKLDHDDLTPYLAYMTEETAEIMVKADTSGACKLPQTGVQNATVGMLFFMDHMAENYNEIPDKQKELQRFVGSFVRFDGILSNRMYKGQNYYHWDPSTLDGKPRSANNYQKMYGRSEMKTIENVSKTQTYIMLLEPKFFGDLFNGRINTPQQAVALAELMTKEYGADAFGKDTQGNNNPRPSTPDELYKAAGAFAGHLALKKPQMVDAMMRKIKEDHSRINAGIKKTDPEAKTMDERRHGRDADLKHHRDAERAKQLSGAADLEDSGAGDGHGHGAHAEHHEKHDEHEEEHPAEGGDHDEHDETPGSHANPQAVRHA